MELNVFTDGSCDPNPGRASLAFYIQETNDSHFEPIEVASNNRCELFAIRAAVRFVRETYPNAKLVTLHSDSEWSVRSILGIYKARRNVDLIREIQNLIQDYPILIRHVKSHCGIEGNEKADELAKAGLKQAIEKWGEYESNS